MKRTGKPTISDPDATGHVSINFATDTDHTPGWSWAIREAQHRTRNQPRTAWAHSEDSRRGYIVTAPQDATTARLDEVDAVIATANSLYASHGARIDDLVAEGMAPQAAQ